MMTRKHFEAIARILKAAHAQPRSHRPEYIADQLALMCMQENERFDYDRFVTACAP